MQASVRPSGSPLPSPPCPPTALCRSSTNAPGFRLSRPAAVAASAAPGGAGPGCSAGGCCGCCCCSGAAGACGRGVAAAGEQVATAAARIGRGARPAADSAVVRAAGAGPRPLTGALESCCSAGCWFCCCGSMLIVAALREGQGAAPPSNGALHSWTARSWGGPARPDRPARHSGRACD